MLIFLGWLILRNSRHGRSSENHVQVNFCKSNVRKIYIFKGISLTVLGLPSESMENRLDLNLHNNFTFADCTFADNLQHQPLLLSLAERAI